jgi:hypothetical protein
MDEQVLADFRVEPSTPFPTVLLVGKRFTGKSTTSVALAGMFTHVHRWAAWCGTKETEDYWAGRFGSSACVWGPDPGGIAALKRIIAYQQKKVRLYGKCLKTPLPAKYAVGLVFDDVTSCRLFRRSEMLESLFSNGRHFRSVIIISCQYPKQLPPAVRTNTDYVVMLHNTKRTCQILFEEYVENPDNFDSFLDLLHNVTALSYKGRPLFNALVYNNCVKTNRLDEMFSVFRHTPGFTVESVQLGSPAWRAFNEDHYRDSEDYAARRLYNKKERMKRLSHVLHADPLDGVEWGHVRPEPDTVGSDSSSDEVCTLRHGKRDAGSSVVVRIPHGYRPPA